MVGTVTELQQTQALPRHDCDRPTDPWIDDPSDWRCPACGRIWELRFSVWYEPTERGLP